METTGRTRNEDAELRTWPAARPPAARICGICPVAYQMSACQEAGPER